MNLSAFLRHTHVSLKDPSGKNIFAYSDLAHPDGRPGAAFEDTKFLSQIGEQFLAGLLDGLPDGKLGFGFGWRDSGDR
jgi:glutamine synthetase